MNLYYDNVVKSNRNKLLIRTVPESSELVFEFCKSCSIAKKFFFFFSPPYNRKTKTKYFVNEDQLLIFKVYLLHVVFYFLSLLIYFFLTLNAEKRHK